MFTKEDLRFFLIEKRNEKLAKGDLNKTKYFHLNSKDFIAALKEAKSIVHQDILYSNNFCLVTVNVDGRYDEEPTEKDIEKQYLIQKDFEDDLMFSTEKKLQCLIDYNMPKTYFIVQENGEYENLSISSNSEVMEISVDHGDVYVEMFGSDLKTKIKKIIMPTIIRVIKNDIFFTEVQLASKTEVSNNFEDLSCASWRLKKISSVNNINLQNYLFQVFMNIDYNRDDMSPNFNYCADQILTFLSGATRYVWEDCCFYKPTHMLPDSNKQEILFFLRCNEGYFHLIGNKNILYYFDNLVYELI